MSSPGSPTLIIDVGARQTERVIAIGLLVAIASVALLLSHSSVQLSILIAGGAVVAAGFRRAGWFGGPRRLTRIVCHPDGHWLLCDRDGRTADASLMRSSRITPAGLWLQWTDSASSVRSLLLLPWDMPEAQFRRLTVRLRFRDRPLSAEGQS
jgi:hypothetical protein